jgi:hypothetical protein
MLLAAFIVAALDAGVLPRDVQIAARHADPRTTTIYDRRRQNFDRHAAYVVVAFILRRLTPVRDLKRHFGHGRITAPARSGARVLGRVASLQTRR